MITTLSTTMPIENANDAAHFCANVTAKLDAFEAILAEETAHVASARLPQFVALTQSKSEAAGAYLQAIEALKRQIEVLKHLAPEALGRLRDRHEALRMAIQHNMRTLATVKAVSEKLLRDVTADTLRSRAPGTYGAGAEMTPLRRETLTTPILMSKRF